MLQAAVEPGREQLLTITPQSADTTLHRLDVRASATAQHGGEVVSLQVRELTITGANGRPLKLIA
jgi:hypothetical protein